MFTRVFGDSRWLTMLHRHAEERVRDGARIQALEEAVRRLQARGREAPPEL